MKGRPLGRPSDSAIADLELRLLSPPLLELSHSVVGGVQHVGGYFLGPAKRLSGHGRYSRLL